MQAPVMVMNTNTKRETGRKAQLANIQAARVIITTEEFTLLSLLFFIHLGCLRNRYFYSRTSVHA